MAININLLPYLYFLSCTNNINDGNIISNNYYSFATIPTMDFDKLKGFFLVIRPQTCFFSVAIYCYGIFIINPASFPITSFLLNGSIIFITVAFSNAINDYFDANSDIVAKLKKPIAMGLLTQKEVKLFCILLFAIFLILNAFNYNIKLVIYSFFCLIFSFLYSYRFKSSFLIGNIIVSLLSGSVIIYSNLFIGNLESKIILIAILMAFFSLVYELLATIRDAKIDIKSGVKTIAYYIGPKKVMILSTIVFGVFIIFNILCWHFGYFTTLYIILFIILIAIPLSGGFIFAYKINLDDSIVMLHRIINITWYLGLIPLLFI